MMPELGSVSSFALTLSRSYALQWGMPSDSWSAEAAGLLAEIDALRERLLAGRRESTYPWDAAPYEAYNALVERVRTVLPSVKPRLTALPGPAPAGARLWRTPADDALDAIEDLRAAIVIAREQTGGAERH